MTRSIAAFLLASGILIGSEAGAQVVVTRAQTAPTVVQSRPYSYYTALPNRARGYVGYGKTDFPYYGHPYGRPYDPWTWAYMGGDYQRSLVRYYDPPVK